MGERGESEGREMKLRAEVQWFAEEMERTLRRHDDRPGWKDETQPWLLDRLREEVEELAKILHFGTPARRILREATDVANFAMMIADVARLDAAPPTVREAGR